MKTSLPKRFRLGIIADPLDNQRAGVHVFTRELISALIRQGKGDHLVLIREQHDPQLPVKQIVVPNIRLPIGFASFRLFFLVPYLLRKAGVDAVFEPAHFGPFNLPKRIKRLTMIHDLTPLLFPQYHRWHSQLLQKIFMPRILRRTNWVFTNSKHTAKDLAHFFPATKSKSTAIYLGRGEAFKPTRDQSILAQYQLTEPYFISVGTIEPRKQLDTLLEAYKTFCLQNDNAAKLLIVGQRGWKTERFDEALDNHPFRDRIVLSGYVPADHLPILYTQSEALIYPSEYEGFGLPIIEALACGTAVITASNSSLQEIGEGSALFFPTGDAQVLAQCMENVLKTEHDSKKFIEHAARFSWENTAQLFWQKVEEIALE